MPKLGSTNITRREAMQLERKVAKPIRPCKSKTLSSEHVTLADSFTLNDYQTYMFYYMRWGTPGRKRQVMLEQMQIKNVTGLPLALAEIRVTDLKIHNLIKQRLYYRWTNRDEFLAKKNETPDTFWEKMAYRIIKTSPKIVDPYWKEPGRLVKYLKKMYEEQNGKCALSGLPMTTTRKDPNMASPDRINSNRGYTRGNIHLTCWWANQMKFDTPLDEFKERIKILHEHFNN